jgi:hypothetical protein
MLSLIFTPLLCLATADVVELGKLKSATPADWKENRVTNSMQIKNFTLPKAEGEDPATLIVYQFGTGVGGLDANIKRWKGMIEPPQGKTVEDITKVTELEVSKIKVTLVDATGTYLQRNMADPSSKPARKENYRLINVYFPTEDAVFTLRLLGPAKSVNAAEKPFMEWLKNFK